MSARRRLARSVRPDRTPAPAIPMTLFGYPVQIVDKLDWTTTKLIAEKVRMGLCRTGMDEDDMLKLYGDPDATDRPVGVLKVKSSPFKIYRPEAN